MNSSFLGLLALVLINASGCRKEQIHQIDPQDETRERRQVWPPANQIIIKSKQADSKVVRKVL